MQDAVDIIYKTLFSEESYLLGQWQRDSMNYLEWSETCVLNSAISFFKKDINFSTCCWKVSISSP